MPSMKYVRVVSRSAGNAQCTMCFPCKRLRFSAVGNWKYHASIIFRRVRACLVKNNNNSVTLTTFAVLVLTYQYISLLKGV